MSADRLINLLVTITIIQMMISVGLGGTLADIGAAATDWHLLIHAAVANYVCVPAVVIGLLLCFRSLPLVAVGLLIMDAGPIHQDSY